MFIKDNSAWINIEMACLILSLSKSAYYDWLSNHEKHLAKMQQDQAMAKKLLMHLTRATKHMLLPGY
jgi:hypothetical protein